MDIVYNYDEIDFVWNSEKAIRNLKNHKISFEIACEVFFDRMLLVENAGIVEGEQREAIIGLTIDWKLLYVVYVMRDNDVRIISARFVTKDERKRYENART